MDDKRRPCAVAEAAARPPIEPYELLRNPECDKRGFARMNEPAATRSALRTAESGWDGRLL